MTTDLMAAGRDALSRGSWSEALATFDRALTTGRKKKSADLFEGLATAKWWLFDLPGAIAARERAFALYKEQGNAVGAARMALWIGSDHHDQGENAVANGWLGRAQRLLEGTDPVPEHALLYILRGHVALMGQADTSSAITLAKQADDVARATEAFDLQMLSIALEGLARVSRGDVDRGMTLLDEATAAATGGEMEDLVLIAWTCCYLIHACYRVRDYNRAAQWCDKVQTFCRRWSFDSMFTTCRTHYASILMWRGEFAAAEEELTTLRTEATDKLPPLVRSAIVRMGELRRRQGKLDEAEELFAQAPDHKFSVLGRAALAMDRDDPQTAESILTESLRRIPSDSLTERLPVLELLVQALVETDDLDQAAQVSDEIARIATTLGGEPLQATAKTAAGLLLAAQGETPKAIRALEDAIYLHEKHLARYEATRVRATLERIMSSPTKTGHADTRILTKREVQVLQLISQGLTDKEAAAKLSISDHTVHRHVSNILTKTGQSSRTAAVAFGTRQGLI